MTDPEKVRDTANTAKGGGKRRPTPREAERMTHGQLAPDPYHPDDPYLLCVTMDMGEWLARYPCECEARCECERVDG